MIYLIRYSRRDVLSENTPRYHTLTVMIDDDLQILKYNYNR